MIPIAFPTKKFISFELISLQDKLNKFDFAKTVFSTI